jgi:hypothetical protein
MDWLLQQAQTASPFVAMFCLVGLYAVIRQMQSERQDHREAEKAFTDASMANALAHEKQAAATAQVSATLNTLVPVIVDLAKYSQGKSRRSRRRTAEPETPE